MTGALQITARNECIVPMGFRKECGIVHAVATSSGEIANQKGDSGGPVIRAINGSTYAAAVVSASTTSDTTGCVSNSPDKCYYDLYYSNIGDVLSQLGATLHMG